MSRRTRLEMCKMRKVVHLFMLHLGEVEITASAMAIELRELFGDVNTHTVNKIVREMRAQPSEINLDLDSSNPNSIDLENLVSSGDVGQHIMEMIDDHPKCINELLYGDNLHNYYDSILDFYIRRRVAILSSSPGSIEFSDEDVVTTILKIREEAYNIKRMKSGKISDSTMLAELKKTYPKLGRYRFKNIISILSAS